MNKVLEITALVFFALFACSVDSIFDSWLVSAFGIVAVALTLVCVRRERKGKVNTLHS